MSVARVQRLMPISLSFVTQVISLLPFLPSLLPYDDGVPELKGGMARAESEERERDGKRVAITSAALSWLRVGHTCVISIYTLI